MKFFALALLLLAAVAPVPDGYRMDDYRAPVPDQLPGGTVVDVTAMRSIVAGKRAVLIDVLPAPRRPDGMRPGMLWRPEAHQSLPGAVWWPDVGRGALAPALEASFHRRLDAASGPDRKLLVFFCLPDCWMSWNAAKRAASWGYRAAWFPAGVDGWTAAGLPTAAVAPVTLE